ncbi:acylneuraminate cytidylyltransferase [Algibacter amylolyticus]|uniref:N-acylneuraminate cytidylyltransferase n=1 Tax=Algibacter amylolyticus TaxID=1608400 RepID=A0A5M7AZ54_9FLAO|nr:acylneuraminate cytidylyltransferase [Algibacter amylolyticus]KAA5822439.1 acylneuraminate cytidylyltransferase [Algibacter amylolyticus]MBB5269162.1 N-acylneuraminate cytidylyltransferase [Algibacter amylolyticus]TSJ73589.1 acylneuraminate cytidylyltransferase [Algibacter amylolyticus]
MKQIGFIPLRKGSKGIPNKNKRKMVGRPLFTWVLGEAIFSNLDEVVVYTDDEAVIEFIAKEYHWTNKVTAKLRSKESASDTASTEFAMLEYCESISYNFESFCLLQATSPFTRRDDINTCLEKLQDNYDSAITVVNTHRFLWGKDGKPLNYDPQKRPRRQDFDGLLIENGAVYTTTKESLESTKNRLGSKVAVVEMPEESLQEIDSETDWTIVEQLLIERQKRDKRSDKITHFVLDVDGVFTDGTITYTKDGEHTKKFDMRDGMGLEILRQFDIKVMIMTSENSALVAKRMEKLKIEHVFLGVKDKFTLLNEIVLNEGITLSNVAYIGDDVNDLTNICSVGWSLIPNNATDIVKSNADVVLSKNSGAGAIREACQFIMNYNKRF